MHIYLNSSRTPQIKIIKNTKFQMSKNMMALYPNKYKDTFDIFGFVFDLWENK